MKKGKINNKLVDVVSSEEYNKNKDIYDPEFTAIEKNGILFPVKNRDPRKTGEVGFYNNGELNYYMKPSEEDMSKYKAEGNVVDFNDAENIKDIMEKAEVVKNMEKEMLTDADNITKPKITEKDEPNMKGLKMAILNKHIDIDKYKERDPQFINNKRLLASNSISWKKQLRWMSTLDLKGTFIIEDKNPDVPNPMNKKIIIHVNSDKDDVYEK